MCSKFEVLRLGCLEVVLFDGESVDCGWIWVIRKKGGLGMGWTLLGPNPASQLVSKRHNFTQFFMGVRFSAGIASPFMRLSLCLQLLKQYFLRNHLGYMLLFLFHFGHLSVCLLAKWLPMFCWWACRFWRGGNCFCSALELRPLFLFSSGIRFLWLPLFGCRLSFLVVAVASIVLIEKVGGRLM